MIGDMLSLAETEAMQIERVLVLFTGKEKTRAERGGTQAVVIDR